MKLISERIIKGIRQIISVRLFHSFLLLTIGGIFLFSGISKALSLNSFVDIVISYHLLPETLARLYGYILPWAEIIIGVLLILRIAPRIASLITIPIILSFIIANSYVLSSGKQDWEGSCGCFGELPFTHTQSLILGIVMLIMATILLKLEIGSPNRKPILIRSLGVLLLSSLVGGALLFAYITSPISTESVSGIQEGATISHIQNEKNSEIDTSLGNNIPVFVYFYVEGCSFCAQQSPIVDELQEELGDDVTFIRVNFEQYREMADEFNVKVTPTIMVIYEKNTEGVYKHLIFNNLTTKETLLENLAGYLPADTTAPVISDITVSDITDNTATISWTTDEPAASNIEYGPGYGYSFPSPSDTTADKTSHSLTLGGLSPDIVYHFRVKSADKTGNEAVSGDYKFILNTTLDTTAPGISGIDVSDITDTLATIFWTTDEQATSNIEYGPDTSYCYSSPSETTADKTSHSLTLSNLSPDTVYQFRIKSADKAGNEAVSGDYKFTTKADTAAPVISDITASDITDNTATISWTTNEPATSNIEYGPDTSYSYSFPSPSDTSADKTSHSLTLSGLSPETAYHFRVKSADNAGNEAVSGDYQFTLNATPDTTAPVISDINVSDITENAATISWTTDEPASSNIEYGPGYGYSFPSPSDTTADKFSHSLTLSSLSSNTVYQFKIKSADKAGNEAVSNYSFATISVLAVTTNQATYVDSPDGDRYMANVNGYLVSLGNATGVSVYFQFGTDTNYGRTSAPVTMTAAGSFMSTFGTGYFYDDPLESDTTYHFRAVAKMSDGTTVYGVDLTFFTKPYHNPDGQIIQPVTLEQAHSMYVARSGEEDFVILQNEAYKIGNLQILGTEMNLSPWCAACPAELQLMDRNKTYLLYAGVGTSGENAYNTEVMSMYMKNMGFMNVYFMTPATVSDWKVQYPGEVIT